MSTEKKHIVQDVSPLVVIDTRSERDVRTLIDKAEPKNGTVVDYYDRVQSVSIMRRQGDTWIEIRLSQNDVRAMIRAVNNIEAATYKQEFDNESLPF